MKIVMVNDCAHVGETLIKYLPEEFKVSHLKRSRSFFDKTFRIAWKILRSKGDVYHVHYLLQDCYLTLKFGKHPVIGHAHGTDLRSSLKHKIWGRIVRYNLESCEKILVSTPDLLSVAREYREDAEYIPNPVDTSVYYPKPHSSRGEKLKVLIAARCDWKAKGTDKVIRALSQLGNEVETYIIRYGKDFVRTLNLAEKLGLKLNVLPKVSHEDVRNYYWSSDVVVASIGAGALSMVALEAIACGRPVITYVSSEYPEYREFPLKDVNTVGKIVEVVKAASNRLWKAEYDYLIRYHKPKVVAEKVYGIYSEVLNLEK